MRSGEVASGRKFLATTSKAAAAMSYCMLCQRVSAAAFAQYQDWQHSGSLYILTTPEGANLPVNPHERDVVGPSG